MNSHDMAGHLIRRLHQQSTQVFAQRTQAAGFDLTPVQFAALDAIQAQPATDQATLLPIVQELQNDILHPLDEAEQSAFLALASRVVRA
jgi:hypothetical protein